MHPVIKRIIRRLNVVENINNNIEWKDPHSPNYDRQWAEDALYHTIGPLTDNPRWTPNPWTSKSEPVPGFAPGGPAPQWSPTEVVYAMAGDPSLLFKPGTKDHPRSPSYGNMGGSPLYRMAMRTARRFARGSDRSFIEDMYGNGFIELSKLMQPGYDEGRAPFVSYVTRNILGAMENGVGGTSQGVKALGGDAERGVYDTDAEGNRVEVGREKTGTSGIKALMSAETPDAARKIANQVKGKFQSTRTGEKHPDNPFGVHSSQFYQVAMNYANALESGDSDRIEAAQSQIAQLQSEIEDSQVFIPGASTGMGQAISTGDRKSSIGVASMDVENDSESGGTMAGNIMGDDGGDSWIDPESVYYILDIALKYDIGKILGHLPKYQQAAVAAGAKDGKIGGVLTVNELRYIIRYLGPLGSNYPGKGVPRSNTSKPRDSNGWWRPGEDPEIEPMANGETWQSIWSRNNYPAMGPTEIKREMTEEVREFAQLGIPTVRTIKIKAGEEPEALTKVAVNTAYKQAVVKLKIIADIHKSHLGLDESITKALASHGFPILEWDDIDRRLISDACNYIVRGLRKTMLAEAFDILR